MTKTREEVFGMTYGQSCGEDGLQECTVHNLHCGYPHCAKGRHEQAIKEKTMQERMLKWFEFAHLPPHLQEVSKPFGELAQRIVEVCEPGPERTVALRKLLESKDAAVRAKLHAGG